MIHATVKKLFQKGATSWENKNYGKFTTALLIFYMNIIQQRKKHGCIPWKVQLSERDGADNGHPVNAQFVVCTRFYRNI